MDSFILQSYIINILCTFKRGLKKQVLVKDVFNIAGVCKKWRQQVKIRLSGMHLNPMRHKVEEVLVHFNNQYCLLDHIHSVVPYNGVICGYMPNPDDGVNYTLLKDHREKVESLVKHAEYLNMRNSTPSFSLSLIQLPLPNLKRLSFTFRDVKDISLTIFNQLQELELSVVGSKDFYTFIGACKNLRKLKITNFHGSDTQLFSLLSRCLISLHLEQYRGDLPYHLLPTTLEELVIPYFRDSKLYEYLINQKIKKTYSFDLTSELTGILPLTSLETISLGVYQTRYPNNTNIVSFLPSTVTKLKFHSVGPFSAKTCINIAQMSENIISLSFRFIMTDDNEYMDNIDYLIGSLANIINSSKKIKKISVVCSSFPSQAEQFQILYQSIQNSQSLERIEFAGGMSRDVKPIISNLNNAKSPYKGLMAIQSKDNVVAILNTINYHIYDMDSISNIIITNKDKTLNEDRDRNRRHPFKPIHSKFYSYSE